MYGESTHDTTVGDQAAEMQPAIAAGSTLECLLDDLVVAQLAVLDRLVDTHNILPHDTPGADIQVADLRVAHEALRQTHC